MSNEVKMWGRYSLGLGWHNEEWALGWADLFACFGLGVLIIGPLHIRVSWPIPVDWE